MPKLFRITTVPISIEKLLGNQLTYMNQFFEVTAISSDKKELERVGKELGVKTYAVDMTRKITPLADLKSLYQMYHCLKKEKPHIVHTHTPKAGLIGMLAAKMAGVKVRLHTVAGLPLMETSGIKRILLNFIEKLTYACAMKVYPNSYGLKDFILKEGFCKEDKLKVIANGSTNGIDTNYFDPNLFSEEKKSNLRFELGIDENDFVFIFVGRLVKDKGINELVSAFLQTISDLKNFTSKLLLLGSVEQDLDPLLPSTLIEIRSNPNIISVGYQKDVRPYLAISNVLVFPSYREGFPNVVMQAGAMGLPAIVSNINGCNEIIIESSNGVIVNVKNEVMLKQAMQKISEDNAFYKKLSKNARMMIVERYQQQIVWDNLLNEYKLNCI